MCQLTVAMQQFSESRYRKGELEYTEYMMKIGGRWFYGNSGCIGDCGSGGGACRAQHNQR